MLKPKYKAVIFDFDDTLVESRAVKWAQHKHVAKNFYNIDLKDEDLRKHWGKPIHVLAHEIYQGKDSWEKMHANLVATRPEFPKIPYTESRNVINELLSKDIRVGILSATFTEDIEEDLKRHDFPVERILVQGADMTEVHKPDPGVFLPLLEILTLEDIQNKDIVYVGDSVDDLKAATLAGLDFIAVTTGLYSESEFKKNGAQIIVYDIKDILNKII